MSIFQREIENWRGFKPGSSFFVYSLKGGGGYWPEGNQSLAAKFIRSIAAQAFDTIQMLGVAFEVNTEAH